MSYCKLLIIALVVAAGFVLLLFGPQGLIINHEQKPEFRQEQQTDSLFEQQKREIGTSYKHDAQLMLNEWHAKRKALLKEWWEILKTNPSDEEKLRCKTQLDQILLELDMEYELASSQLWRQKMQQL
ncbi:MAG: hypothetical protein MUP16_04835, partial [Sedimentisphaerales bacterium]|nr:hypothetical protein [Sedimentisphaerales bacterium]